MTREELTQPVGGIVETTGVNGSVATQATALPAAENAAEKPDIVEEVLVEEVSIDGMCGVY